MPACRDPRWGRQSETYGEDPLLSASIARAFVEGLQGGPGDGQYLKVSATCKVGGALPLPPDSGGLDLNKPPAQLLQHFVGNDLEDWRGVTRYNFDARLSDRDMRETFAVPFEACVRAKAASVMCSYNKGGPSLLVVMPPAAS